MDKSGSPTRIVIADDHPILRNGLRSLLEAERDLCVVGEAGDGVEAVQTVRDLKPDIVLLDIVMPRQSGLEALGEIGKLPNTSARSIVLAASMGKAEVAQAIQLGARGVILKESATQLLLQCIRAVEMGRYWIGHQMVSDLVEALRDVLPALHERQPQNNFSITSREMEIIGAIVSGCANKDIAQKFSISEQTVKHHLTNIFDKLGVSNRLELALFAVNHHLTGDS